jgi:hypothetical protein
MAMARTQQPAAFFVFNEAPRAARFDAAVGAFSA